ncbi:hypothetical protein LTR17_026866 [Elasticomyces elasticus]|nr:hypothetical protein LTR17_026866 [Elasticomyces elasticus]
MPSADDVYLEATQSLLILQGTNPTETKAWLEPTRKLLSLTKGQELQESDEQFFQNTLGALLDFLGKLFDDQWAPKAETNLRKIITAGFDLFKLLHESRAVFKINFSGVDLFSEKNRFRTGIMQAIASDEEEAALMRRPLQMVVFPGVFKFGNELGHNVSILERVHLSSIADYLRLLARRDGGDLQGQGGAADGGAGDWQRLVNGIGSFWRRMISSARTGLWQ